MDHPQFQAVPQRSELVSHRLRDRDNVRLEGTSRLEQPLARRRLGEDVAHMPHQRYARQCRGKTAEHVALEGVGVDEIGVLLEDGATQRRHRKTGPQEVVP